MGLPIQLIIRDGAHFMVIYYAHFLAAMSNQNTGKEWPIKVKRVSVQFGYFLGILGQTKRVLQSYLSPSANGNMENAKKHM